MFADALLFDKTNATLGDSSELVSQLLRCGHRPPVQHAQFLAVEGFLSFFFSFFFCVSVWNWLGGNLATWWNRVNSRRSRQVLITVSIHQGKYCVGKKMFNYLLMRRFILSFLEIDRSGPKFRFYATLTPISRRQPIFCIHYIDLTFTVSKPCQMPPSDIVALSSLNPPNPLHTHIHTHSVKPRLILWPESSRCSPERRSKTKQFFRTKRAGEGDELPLWGRGDGELSADLSEYNSWSVGRRSVFSTRKKKKNTERARLYSKPLELARRRGKCCRATGGHFECEKKRSANLKK